MLILGLNVLMREWATAWSELRSFEVSYRLSLGSTVISPQWGEPIFWHEEGWWWVRSRVLRATSVPRLSLTSPLPNYSAGPLRHVYFSPVIKPAAGLRGTWLCKICMVPTATWLWVKPFLITDLDSYWHLTGFSLNVIWQHADYSKVVPSLTEHKPDETW